MPCVAEDGGVKASASHKRRGQGKKKLSTKKGRLENVKASRKLREEVWRSNTVECSVSAKTKVSGRSSDDNTNATAMRSSTTEPAVLSRKQTIR